jgi:hypothetical protein
LLAHGERTVGFPAVANEVPGDVVLAPLTGEPRTLREWTTTFHLVFVVLDPFTYESSWILPTATRLLQAFAEADGRTSYLVTGTEAETRQFLGPLAREFLAFADPERIAVKAMGLDALPAFVHVNMRNEVDSKAEGWEPDEWRAVAHDLARVLSWRAPVIPQDGDPLPFPGTPALG